MFGSRKTLVGLILAVAPLAGISLPRTALAYIDLAPTLSKIVSDSKRISVVEISESAPDKQQITLREVQVLKGDPALQTIHHLLQAPDSKTTPRAIAQWAAPGARGVLFGSRTTSLVCIGEGWYQVRSAADGTSKLGIDRPDLPLAYYGRVSTLADSVAAMLAGKDTVLTVVAHGADNEAASFDLALNRQSLPDGARTQRIRANLKMPGSVASASANPAYMIGSGSVDEADVPQLIEKLKSSPAGRADAADDLRQLGPKAASAADTLTTLLSDPSARTRLAAASALLRITPKNANAVAVIATDLNSSDEAVRREAARAAGFIGADAAPLVDRLAALLKDPDDSTRIASLQSIALLGPVAAKATDAVTPLLDDPAFTIDAADALGRIGTAATPALKRLAELLASDQAAVRWAAVRGMSQIGGPDAHPAVDFMMKAFPNATEVEGYNMMIYLSLLGPVANDATATVESMRIKNPVLPSATLWVISKNPSLPWLNDGRETGGPGGGMRGRMGGAPPGGMGGGMGDIFQLVYQAYVRELGERLRPDAVFLARKITEGTAGDVPDWGYEVLNSAPADSIAIFTPALASDQRVMRERATVALGYMGQAASPAQTELKSALARAGTESEKRLIQWAIDQSAPDTTD